MTAWRSRTRFGPGNDNNDDNNEDNQAVAAGNDHVLDQSTSGVGRSAVAPAPPSCRRSIADDDGTSSTGCHSKSDAATFLRFSASAASWPHRQRRARPTHKLHAPQLGKEAPRAARRNSRQRRRASPVADNRSTPASEAKEGVRPSRWLSESWSQDSCSSSLVCRSAPSVINPSR